MGVHWRKWIALAIWVMAAALGVALFVGGLDMAGFGCWMGTDMACDSPAGYAFWNAFAGAVLVGGLGAALWPWTQVATDSS